MLPLGSRPYPVRQTTMATKQTPAGHKAQRAARKPSPVTVVQAAPAQAPNPAAVLANALAAVQPKPVLATPATAMASMAATLANPASKAPVVAVRGGLAIQAVKLTGVQYRVGCSHNATWWQQCQALAAGGSATVQALVQAGVPAAFVGYVVRRGYMVPVQA